MPISPSANRRKQPTILVLTCGILLSVIAIQIDWILKQRDLPLVLTCITAVSAASWFFVLAWAVHQLVFRIGALASARPRENFTAARSFANFTILYVTRHDFSEDAIKSCLQQEYPPDSFRVVICDDSDSPVLGNSPTFGELLQQHANAAYFHRTTRRGFKAGNLNDAVQRLPPREGEWIVIVDADDMLPKNYLAIANAIVCRIDDRVGFVQGCPVAEVRSATSEFGEAPNSSWFQSVMAVEAAIFWGRDLDLRPRCGFVPFLGRGGIVRRETLEVTQGFPEVVSEDLAFAWSARDKDLHGELAPGLRLFDPPPCDFGAFLTHKKKTTAGAAELMGTQGRRFLTGRAALVERFDAFLWLCGYGVQPLVVANLFLSTYVSHAVQQYELSVLHPWLTYFFIGMAALTIPGLASMAESFGDAVRYACCGSAVHAAILPITAWRMCVHLCVRPEFVVTPKAGSPPARPRLSEVASAQFLGGLLGALATICWSPFSWIAFSYAFAWVLFPLWYELNDSGWLGRTARVATALPILFFSMGLARLWQWSLV